ncbi:MAG: NUDIX hydrolase [Nanoarchaeota archaeon]
MIEPWKKLIEEKVYSNHRKIFKKTFVLPSGREEYFDIVSGDHTSFVFALTEKGKVILSRQFRPGPERVYDDLPAGFIDKGETPMDAARRELLEETGYSGNFEYVGSFIHSAYVDTKLHLFIARDCSKVQEPRLDENEFIEVVEKSIQDFVKQVRAGDLTNAHLAYKALDHLGLLK